MKHILLFTAIFGITSALIPQKAMAYPEPTTPTVGQCGLFSTCYAVNVATANGFGNTVGATSIFNSTKTTSGITVTTNSYVRELWIQDQDPLCNLFCSDLPTVDTPTISGSFDSGVGWEVMAGTITYKPPTVFHPSPGSQWYCTGDCTGQAKVKAEVCVCR